jgi:hypothetical protein
MIGVVGKPLIVIKSLRLLFESGSYSQQVSGDFSCWVHVEQQVSSKPAKLLELSTISCDIAHVAHGIR